MNGKFFLLDTNIVIALFNDEQKVIKKIDGAEKIFLPIIVLGELYLGVELSNRKEENLQKVENLCYETPTILITNKTAIFYAKIKAQLRIQGTPIPENDVWIAAISLENNLPLVSRDNHFKRVKNLKLIEW